MWMHPGIIAAAMSLGRTLQVTNRGGPVRGGISTARDATNVRHTCRYKYIVGIGGARDLAVVYPGIYIPSSGGTETNLGNAQTIRAHVEIASAPGTTVKVFTWAGGASSGTIPNGAGEYVSDSVSATAFGYASYIPAGTVLYIVTEREVASGQFHINGHPTPSPLISGELALQGGAYTGDTTNTNPATWIGTAGALSAGGSGANPWVSTGTIKYGPLAIIGKQGVPAPVIIGAGDSIMKGVADTEGDGYGDGATAGGGWFRRGLASIGGAGVPLSSINLGNRGETLATYRANKTMRGAMYKYGTHAMCDYGTNEFVTSTAYDAAYKASLAAEIAIAKAAGITRWEQIPLFPRTSSSPGNWTAADGSDQTELTTASFNTKRAAFNTDIFNLAITGQDAYFDAASPIYNTGGGGTTKWRADGSTAKRYTGDGTHPDDTTHEASILIAAGFATRAATWTYSG